MKLANVLGSIRWLLNHIRDEAGKQFGSLYSDRMLCERQCSQLTSEASLTIRTVSVLVQERGSGKDVISGQENILYKQIYLPFLGQ